MKAASFKPEKVKPARVQAILRGLAEAYPNAECALAHRSAWQLLLATILSAQCTDARVNLVTPLLFQKIPTVKAMAALSAEALEPEIRSTGFYRNKAKAITGAARRIVEAYGGKVPDRMEDLLTLPGVARKTANVVLGVWFHQASGVVVDTHVQRVSQRLELTQNTAPEKIEQDLQAILPQREWIAFSHRVIAHGRQCCLARKPKCSACGLEPLCHAPDKTYSSR
ncbi:MAG TPA: endonuclease III [Terriglobales bacterium]|nr:endonuclease III [Terriglobales bacterium]